MKIMKAFRGVFTGTEQALSGGRGRGGRGFTLIELLISLAIVSIAAAALYAVFVNFFKQQQRMDLSLESEQNARAAIDSMERELLNAGYLSGTMDIITVADANNIEFVYTDPSDCTVSATCLHKLKVKYAYAGGKLTRNAEDQTDGSKSTGTLDFITDVKSFQISYYDKDGAAFTPTDQTMRNSVRFADIALVTQTKTIPQGMTAKATFSLTTHLKLRNVDTAQTATDTDAPLSPTNVKVRDPGICGRLRVQWTPSTSGDVAGHTIYYGTAPGDYTGAISIPKSSLSDGSTYWCDAYGGPCTISPQSVQLQYTPSDGSTVTYYYVAVKAYDNSMNSSAYSTEVSGASGTETLAGSNSSFTSGADDTTVNPKKPAINSGFSFSGADGDADGKVQLTWSGYDTATYPDVTGFRIYRKLEDGTDFTFPIPSTYQLNPTSGQTVGIGATSYSDSDGAMVGCKAYRYAIAPVNCDPSLVTYEGEAANADHAKTPYYESVSGYTNYAETYGDGSSYSGADYPAGADTAPPDSTGPAAPDFHVKAGYKRVAINFTQPGESNIDRTCIYGVEGSSYPELDAGKDADKCNTPITGKRLPEYSGVFPAPDYPANTAVAFWNNDVNGASTMPVLNDNGTYSYRAASYDLCGNVSSTVAKDTTTLCGEDPVRVVAGVTTPKLDKPQFPASPAPTITVSGCGGVIDPLTNILTVNLTANWTEIPSDLTQTSTATNPYDLAGYRLIRATQPDFSDGVLLNTDAPWYKPPYSDTGTADGGIYYYRVYGTDCPFEKGDNGALTASNMMTWLNGIDSAVVYPGRLDRDEAYKANNGSLDAHREVLVGVDIDGSGNAAPKSAYGHGSVTMFMQNTQNIAATASSAETLVISSAAVSWVNDSAFLREVWVGGGTSGVGRTQVLSLNTGDVTPVTGNDPYTSAIADHVVSTAVDMPGGARNIPVEFVFTDKNGDPVDMRGDQLLVTFTVTNKSTGSTDCVSYMTVSGTQTGVGVSVGPSVQSVTQNKPNSPTFPLAVPGASGNETAPTDGATLLSNPVSAGVKVTVTATIIPNTLNSVTGLFVSVASAKLYYAVTDVTVGAAPDPAVSGNYTSISMSKSGNLWTGVIPMQTSSSTSPKRIWYYIVAKDDDGNFDRRPALAAGEYVYDQKGNIFLACDHTPASPSNIVFSSSDATQATVRWQETTAYSDGTSFDKTNDPITYQVWRRYTSGGSFANLTSAGEVSEAKTSWTSVAPVTSPATAEDYYCGICYSGTTTLCCFWKDTVATGSYDLTYYVVPHNSCSATANLGTAIKQLHLCQGASAGAIVSVSPSTIYTGDSYTVTVTDCNLSGNGTKDTITVNNKAALTGSSYNKSVSEAGTGINDNGVFTATVTTYKSGGTVKDIAVAPASDAANDTVTVSCGSGCTASPAPTTATVTVKAKACDFTPTAPATVTATRRKSGNNCLMDVSWTASASWDANGYKLYRSTNGSTYTAIGTYSGTTLSVTGLTPATNLTATGSPKTCVAGTDYYAVTTLDSCSTALESAKSAAVGPK
ncbi:MAG: prepilin-type N-terminal cleavage/methylation domain-containing protein [Deltaproteobacteria bacterium]|nr:prepilin-type N-terminal cleavage/methylation domain-containing protein [Deltaproteobacteria bacterium]